MDARSECVTCSACHASLEKRPQRCATDLAVSARSSCDIEAGRGERVRF